MKCPGQDSRYWKESAIFEVKCPKCDHTVEFFKDDPSRRCGNCGHRFLNPAMDFGCASYCEFAEHCIGTLPPELIAQKENLLKDRVAVEMKKYFKQDFKRIGHAMRVARYAEHIGKNENGNLAVILAAAYLHDIGIHAAEQKYSSSAAIHQEKEGPPIARDILEKLRANEQLIAEVCDIIAHHHHPREHETTNFKVLYDADRIANMEEQIKKAPLSVEAIEKKINASFLTDSGREEARRVLTA